MKILLSSLIPAVICSYLITVSAYGQGGDNPALADLNAAVTYYWSFDSENTEADLTEKELSIKPEGTPVFDSGKFGKGLRIGPTQGGRTILNFPEKSSQYQRRCCILGYRSRLDTAGKIR